MSEWSVSFAIEADAFLRKNNETREMVLVLVRKALLKFQGSAANVDIKKLKGEWAGFYRIRKGELRIIVEFNFENRSVFVERVDWRGSVYR
jgi:mRNA interferase RelE/StbE